MWILVWMQLVTNQGVDYYQLGNYGKKEECIKDVTTNKLVRNKWSRYLFVRKPAYWNMNLPGYYRNNGGMEKLEPIKVRVTEIVDD
jgi:hypothetical protein